MLSEGVILQIVVYIVSLSAMGGTIVHRVSQLEKKVEKHNQLVERMVAVEQSAKSAHHRIDRIDETHKKWEGRGYEGTS